MNNVLRAAFAAPVLLVCPLLLGANLFREPLPVEAGIVPGLPPGKLVTGDFTGDGRPDLLTLQWAGTVPSEELGDAVVVPADGTGPFAAPIRSRVAHVDHVAVADVNGDGKLDLVGAAPYRLRVFLGNGNGTFQVGAVLEDTSIDPVALVLGDFTGDGKRDAAVITWGGFSPSTVAVFPGNGNGSFGTALTTTVNGMGITELRAGDVNGDGVDDIVTGGTDNFVLLGGPAGVTSAGSLPGFAGPVALGNLNDDGALDAVVFAHNTLSLFAGNGTGGFTLLAEHSIPDAQSLAITDMTGDGRPEVVAFAPVVSILRARGAGVFDPPRFSHALFGRGSIGSFAADDFDGDGKGDLVACPDGSARVSFFKGNRDGTLMPDRVWRTHPRVFADFERPGATADLNGDGRADVITTATENDVHSLAVLLNDGTGELGRPFLTTLPAAPGNFTVAFLDAGSRPDVLMFSGGSARAFYGNADGTFTAGPVTPLGSFFDDSLLLADVTGDGKADLLTGSTCYPGTGGGAFGTQRSIGMYVDAAGDLTGDGVAEVIGHDGSIRIGINDGTGNFAFTLLPRSEAMPRLVADFTGDGKLDILATTLNEAYVYRGRGDGTFDPPVVTLAVTMFPNFWKTADFDGDGNLDLVAGRSILLGHGDGRFHDMVRIDAAGYAETGDFDANGRPDLALFGAGVVRVMLNGLASEPSRTTATTLVSTEASTTYGGEVSFVSRTAGGITPVHGTVVLSAAGVPFALLPADWIVSGDIAAAQAGASRATPVGSYLVTATYTGNSLYQPSMASVPLTVNRAPSELLVDEALDPVNFLNDVSFQVATARLRRPYLPGPVHTVPVVRSGNEVLAVEWSQNGYGAISGLPVGTHSLTFELAGDDNYEPATAATTATVEKLPTSIELTFTPERPEPGPVTFNAVVDAGSKTTTTGTVRFFIDGQDAGSATLVDERAQFTASLAAGVHFVSADYGGDGNHRGSSAHTVPVTVSAPWGTPIVIRTSFDGQAATIAWTPLTGAKKYRLYFRNSSSQPWSTFDLFIPWIFDYFNSPVTRMYAVAAQNAAGEWTPISAPKLFTSVLFTDDPALARATLIKGAHITQLRAAANAVRTFAGLAPFPFTDDTLQRVRAVHMTELRTALSQARTAIGMPVSFTDPVLTARTSIIRAVHIQELRNATR